MDQLMQMVCHAGKMLLESGAETYRVEETMIRICQAYGIDDAESFVLPTGVFLSVVQNGEVKTMVQRVKRRAVNLEIVDQINTLSREASSQVITLLQFRDRLHHITVVDQRPTQTVLLAATMTGAAFAYFYQGNWRDAIVASICSLAVKYLVIKLEQYGVNNFISNCIGGGCATLIALIFMSIGVGEHLQIIISSSIMLLVPGVALTNAIRDSFAGDLVSGMAKAAEAIIVAISIALGTGAVLGLWVNIGGLIG